MNEHAAVFVVRQKRLQLRGWHYGSSALSHDYASLIAFGHSLRQLRTSFACVSRASVLDELVLPGWVGPARYF